MGCKSVIKKAPIVVNGGLEKIFFDTSMSAPYMTIAELLQDRSDKGEDLNNLEITNNNLGKYQKRAIDTMLKLV